ncbi:MAG: hypothetical protein GX444_08300 [Myxococcales bacterium]|nr:hypothetical protein [Myxococcales bacterium]
MNRGKILEYLLRQSGYCGSGWPNKTAALGGRVDHRGNHRNDQAESEGLGLVAIGQVLEGALLPLERQAYVGFLLARKGEEISTMQHILTCSRATAYRQVRQIEWRLREEFRKRGIFF